MRIPLTKGVFTLIDDADFDLVARYKWHANKSAHSLYACRTARDNGVKRKVYMHRLILGCSSDEQGHHIDGDTLNNRRDNLEKCSKKDNLGYRKWGTH